MKKIIAILSLLLISALLLAAAPAAEQTQWHYEANFAVDGLGGTIECYLAEKGVGSRSVTIGWKDIETGEEWYLGADVFMEGASTYKLPLAMFYADKVAEGSLTREDKVGSYTVDLAVREALVNSSNVAADALRGGISANQAEYRSAIAVNCGLSSEELPSGYYTANQFSPRYLIGTLRTLWDNSEKYDWLLDYMKQAQPNDCFSRYRGSYEVAHKTGNALGFICDTGIIYTARPFLLTVMSSGIRDADRMLGEIARIAMDYAEYLAEQDSPASTPEPTPEPIQIPANDVLTQEPYLSPAGTDSVHEISDADGLRGIALAPEDSYRLTADIDLSGADWMPIPFYGTLDGAGHTIYNLTLRTVGADVAECRDGNNIPYDAHYAALFSVARNATVRDLQLRGVYAEVESEDNCFVAALAGYAYDLTAENVSVEGRLRLYAHGKIVGVGGVIGFGSGWFTDCRSDVELVFEDRNIGLHCEQFLGGLAASGKFTAKRCVIEIRGYASVNGFVHTGGMVGMYCGYGLVRNRMMSVTDCTVTGKISFFENNFTRRAYCRGFAGEQVDLVINERNDISGFMRDERFDFRVILSPESCAEPQYTETVIEPGCTDWGYTEHVCQGCGYSWIDSYTSPHHTPGETEIPCDPTAAPKPSPSPHPSPLPGPSPSPDPSPTPLAMPEQTPFSAPEPEAVRLEIKLTADQKPARLLDGDVETCCLFAKGAELRVSATEEIGGVYLVWYDRPYPWTLELPGESLSCGEQGFMHEFVPLPHGARELTIRFPETESVRLSEICAFSPGRVPDDVQIWQSPCEQADILLIPTHADDEFVFFGGIIPLYASERGLDVQVIYMISHYRSLRIRCHELLDALWYAGIRHYPVVNDAPDREIYSIGDAEYIYGKNSFVDYQVEQIRRFRPLVIVTHAENGEYRQGSHIFTALSLERAVVLAADESYQNESAARWGVWDTPKTYLHLYGRESERTVLDYETPLAAFDGKTAFEVAEKAFALHASQADSPFRVFERGHAYDCHSFGLYRSLVGPDRERTDLMENIDRAALRS